MCLVLFLVYMNLQVLHDSTGTKFRHNSRSWPEYTDENSGDRPTFRLVTKYPPGYCVSRYGMRPIVPAHLQRDMNTATAGTRTTDTSNKHQDDEHQSQNSKRARTEPPTSTTPGHLWPRCASTYSRVHQN